jgi:drug/metabolite transporter (DMT)-like permease
MKLVEYSVQWAKGESFEGMCIVIAGVLTLVCSLLIWKFGTTVNAKALLVPAFVLGLLFSTIGGFMLYSNNQRIAEFQNAYQTDSEAFIENEKKRVEDFQFMYPTSLAVSVVCFLITVLAFVFSKNPPFHAIGIVLTVFGVSLIIIDYFSKERAQIYYDHILNNL